MKREDLLKKLDEWVNLYYPESEILIYDGLEEAFLGVAEQFNNPIPIFDRGKCIDLLVKQGMTVEEAREFFDVNIQGAWVGPNTPAFLFKFNVDYEENNGQDNPKA